MTPVFRLLYAAHASGSHHKLVMRALEQLRAPDAEGWQRLLLSRARLLLEGSKEPDKSFRDFQNHVLHPASAESGGEFGGAPEAAQRWYDRLVDMLERGGWDDAAHAAGVLSHYICDPLMPLHTGSSDAETHVHRGVEWTISRDFDALWEAAPTAEELGLDPSRLTSDDWLPRLIRHGARRAHDFYHPLIEAYDRKRGAAKPEEGLEAAGRQIASRQLARSAATIAMVFDRAIIEARVAPPKVDLTLRLVVATLGVPFAWVRKKLEDAGERAAVGRIYRELEQTGALVKNMPAECRTVRLGRDLASKQRASGGGRRSTPSGRRTRLHRASPVVDAPSIGPKIAARLTRLGVATVGDLLAAEPKSVAERLRDRRISADTVAIWRDQAALLVRMPRLRRSEAALLVASDFRTVEVVGSADAVRLRDAMMSAARKPEMARRLRSAIAPDLSETRKIVEAAREIAQGL